MQLSDEHLLAQCSREAFRGAGPGGQKRNKTSSAVRITHQPTSISITAQEDRSQSKNLQLALRRLRFAIAHSLRRPGQHAIDALDALPNALELPPKHPDRPHAVALVFDVLDADHWSLHQSAARLNITTAQLSRFLTQDPDTHAAANTHRARHSLRPLRT